MTSTHHPRICGRLWWIGLVLGLATYADAKLDNLGFTFLRRCQLCGKPWTIRTPRCAPRPGPPSNDWEISMRLS